MLTPVAGGNGGAGDSSFGPVDSVRARATSQRNAALDCAVETGMAIELLERTQPQWTIAAANTVIYHGRRDAEAMRALVACPSLSTAWREDLNGRLAKLNGNG